MKRIAREALLRSFREKRSRKEALLIGDIGVGITGKMAEKAGIDMLEATTLGVFRMRGVDDEAAFRPHSSCNELTASLVKRLGKVVQATPVLAGVGAADPNLDLDRYFDELIACGVSGITNLPSAGIYDGSNRRNIDAGGMGFPEERKMIAAAREKGLFTLGHGFFEEDVLALTEAGADMVCINLRYFIEEVTQPELYHDLEKVCTIVQHTLQAAKKINPAVLVVVHGGPFGTRENIQRLYELTDADGVVVSSVIDSVPISESVSQVVTGFLNNRLR